MMLTHNELCDLAVKWIRKSNSLVFVDKEVHAPTGQIPDAIGLGFYGKSKNPNVNEWAEYQICLKAMKEHKVRCMPK